MPTYFKNRCVQFSTMLILSDFSIMASMEESRTLMLDLTINWFTENFEIKFFI